MSPSQTARAKTNAPHPDYAWLERVRQVFQQLAQAPDSAALEGIIAEGQARLEKVNPDDPLLAGYLRLAVAEAQLNLALEQRDEYERQPGFAAGRQDCEQAVEEAFAAGSGVACNILPRAITLLSVLYKASPEAHQPDLADSLQSIAAQLDQALQEQAFLRQTALEGLQSARLLLASLDGLVLEERRNLLEQVAAQILNAGEMYLEAGDMDMLGQVQSDLVEIEKSLNNPTIPAPRLVIFEQAVEAQELLPEMELPELDARAEPEIQALPFTPYRSRPARQPNRRRASPLHWALSIGGLVVSCLIMLCSGASLYNGLANRNGVDAQESALLLTQTVFSLEMTAMAPGVIPVDSGQAIIPTQPLLSPSTPTAPGVACPGAPDSRLAIGDQASVGDVGGYSLTIYADAGYQSAELYYLEEGDFLSIIGGPVCVQNQLWWQVNLDQGHTGWAPESSETGAYLLNP